MLLHQSMILVIGLTISDVKWEGCDRVAFYLAKLMIIIHFAFTGDNGQILMRQLPNGTK